MEDTQALAVAEHNTGLTVSEGVGLEDVYVRPSNIILVQRTNTMPDAVVGKLFDVRNEANLDSIQVVPLQIRQKRVLFPEDGTLGAKPICRSDNGIVPSPFAEFPQHETCKGCPKGSWDDYDAKTGKGKPPCKIKYEWLFILRDSGLPRRFTVGGTSINPTKELRERLREDQIMSRAKGEIVNIFDYTFTISPFFVQGAKGSYYVVKYSNLKRVQTPGEFGPLYEQYVVSARARKEQEEADAAEQAVEAAIPVEAVQV